MNLPSTTPRARTVIIATPDTQSAEYLQSLVASFDDSLSTIVCGSLQELYDYTENHNEPAVLLAELVWESFDASEVLLNLSLSHGDLGILIVSSQDVSELIPPFHPLAVVPAFQNPGEFNNALAGFLENLGKSMLGPYRIDALRGQGYLSRRYFAHQPNIHRDVELQILLPNCTNEERELFQKITRARGANIHPSIYPIYEASEINGRFLQSQEPVKAPTLFELRMQDAVFDSRLIARIISTIAGALKHLHSRGIPHQIIDATHITLSSEGVIKLMNTALPEGEAIPNESAEIAALAGIIRGCMPPTGADADAEQEPIHPQVVQLIEWMEYGQATIEELIPSAQSVDLALAPEKFVPQRQEAVQAKKAVAVARKNYKISLISGIVVGTLFAIFMIYYVLVNYLIAVPGTDFKKQLAIPAGEVKSVRGTPAQVNAFYLDEYEVTIGQYEKFLKSVKDTDPKTLIPPNFPLEKANFEPKDWQEIITSIKDKKPYMGEKLSRDTPVFNVDYADAYAYAKWAGKRLPTEAEWQRAASGNDNRYFPWGSEEDLSKANTGSDKDGIRGLCNVNEMAEDKSPYGVRDMAGNVSEWVQTTPQFGLVPPSTGIVRGGNFDYPGLIPNQQRIGQLYHVRKPWLGFRCASDQPVNK